jgi:hypothetical protein
MTKQTKIILIASLIAFVISATGAAWGLFLPLGAILFGLFLISNALAKEIALYDQEQRSRESLSKKPDASEAHNVSALRPARSR